ncbi:adenylosuccinate lyase [Malacoplasma penetrans]|uniref:Adenylosuccinate lyase n=1 Tax=Malacoplasma penetrans (strain HF-2) TaxID=272633 RepID=Q8EVI2_MALP2|nr:adenylosuccinate lyase [Malacoplasma penetrans]RXY96914.1 adenylosuccinate lyase [Malacoplasma penetrans]BAC44372.1 adenylosuccinate lyase [Malacoplasma penetrans HF-2]
MIKRYEVPIISKIWSDENKFNTWLKIEKCVINYFYVSKKIDEQTFNLLNEKMSFDLNEIYEIEKNTKHDVIAFLRAISLNIKEDSVKKWIHYGLTSTDVVDTANAVMLKETNLLIIEAIKNLMKELKKKAFKYKDLVQIGRTHGIHGEPTSFGYKFAIWYDELNRNLERLNLARKEVEVGKISGAVGTFANTGLKLQDYVCKKLKINSSNASTQIIQRDNHAFYFATLAVIASTVEKIATELRHLSRTEVSEVSEFFDINQKGSSAMPHKKNPISLENICGLSRMIKAYSNVALENNDLWHERDISHSSNERIMFLDATTLTYYVIERLTKVIANLNVYVKNIQKNLKLTNGLIYSQALLLKLLENENLSREFVYDEIQKIALLCFNNNLDFKSEILKSKLADGLTEKDINFIFDEKHHLKYINDIYKRIFR